MKEVSFRHDVLPLKDKLFRLALSITRNREEAEDIVQDTLLKVWTKCKEGAVPTSIEAYSLTACKNLSIDRLAKAENRNVSLDYTEGAEPETSQTVEDQMIVRERRNNVLTLMSRLPDKQRAVMELRDVEGKEYKEIAEIMGITESDVKVTLFRARQKIKEQYIKLDRYGL